MTSGPLADTRVRAILRLLAAALLVLVTASLLRQGDLLALPALALIVATWTLLLASALAVRAVQVLRRSWPRLTELAGLAWASLRDEPEIIPVTSFGRRTRARSTPLLTRLAALRVDVVRVAAGAAVLAAASGIAVLGVLVRAEPPALDRRFVDLATQLQTEAVRRAMLAFTGIGDTITMVGLLFAIALVLWRLHDRRGIVLLLATPVLASSTTNVLKLLMTRPRPAVGQLVEASHSWPSGHTTLGLSVAWGLVLLAHHRRWDWRLVAAAVLPLGLLIGYSRAYLRVHWLTDVAAGWLVATAAAAIVVIGTRRWSSPTEIERAPATRFTLAMTAATVTGLLMVAGTASQRVLVEPPTAPSVELATTDPVSAVLQADPFSRTLFGRAMEPISLIVVADEATFIAAAERAGWTLADRPTISRLASAYDAGLRRRDDLSAPVTPTFYGVLIQDLAISQPAVDGAGLRARHHARFWDQRVVLADGCRVWFGTASLDDRIEWNWHTLVPEHHIDPAVDVEREHVAETLAATGLLQRADPVRVAPPTLGTNAATDPFFTDGQAVVLRQPGACAGS